MKKRLESILLALVMLLTLVVPASALTAHNDHSGHADHAGWTALTNVASIGTEGETGNYYLSGSLALSQTLTIADGATVNLCLNGYTLTGPQSATAIKLGSGATLNLYDESGSSGSIRWSGGTGVYIARGAVFKMYGGQLDGRSSYGGKAVEIMGADATHGLSGGLFVMRGGVIANSKGFGVYLSYSGTLSDGIEPAVFDMKGGKIADGTTGSDNGGAVGLYANGIFTMEGGSITGNACLYSAINVVSGTGVKVNLLGGSITGNNSTGSGNYCGGVKLATGSTLTLGGTQLSGNTSKGQSNDLYIEKYASTADENQPKVILTKDFKPAAPVAVSSNVPSAGGGCFATGWSAVQGKKLNECFAGAEGCEFTLRADGDSVVMDAAPAFKADISTQSETVTKGSKYTLSVETVASGSVSYQWFAATDKDGADCKAVSGATKSSFTCPTNEAGTKYYFCRTENSKYNGHYTDSKIKPLTVYAPAHTPHDGHAAHGDGWTALTSAGGALDEGKYYLNGNVTLTNNLTVSSGIVELCLNGYTLTGNGNGSVITVSNGAVLLLCDVNGNTGKLTGGRGRNEQDNYLYVNGGGVRVNSGSGLIMNGGTITGNSANSAGGGGVYVNQGSFTMNGGVISGNACTESNSTGGGSGGGVYISSSVFTMNGGTISDNTVAGRGGGIYATGCGVFTMNGGTVSGNTAVSDKNGNGGYGGGVYLDNCTVTMSGVTVSGNEASGGYGGVYVGGGGITMAGCTVTGNTASGGSGGGVCLYNGSGHVLSDVTVTGNSSTRYGGGVYVWSTAKLMNVTLTNVTVTGNTAAEAGGGVYASDDLTLTGANSVSGNTHGSGEDKTADNLYMTSGKKIILTGALSNTKPIGVTMDGEDELVLTDGWSTYMSGKSVAQYFTSDDTAFRLDLKNNEVTRVSDRYAISIRSMTHGSVSASVDGKTATKAKGGKTVTLTVSPENGWRLKTLTVTNTSTLETVDCRRTGDLTYEFDMPGAGVMVSAVFETGKTEMSWPGLQAALSGAESGDTIKLQNNVSAGESDTALTLSTGKSVTLDLNGFTLDRGLKEKSAAADGSVITITYGVLTLTDGSGSKTGKLTGGSAKNGGGVSVNGLTDIKAGLILTSGTVSGNNADRGGGVYVYGNSSFLEMTGGSITGNTCGGSNGGGGVYCCGASSFTLSGGEISNNTTEQGAGGVELFSAVFTMTGGKISGNKATGEAGQEGKSLPVGGVLLGSGADKLLISGGEITGNSAPYGSGGVRASVADSVIVHGSPRITGNTGENNAANNVFLRNNGTLCVDGELTGSALIGVTMEVPGVFARAKSGDGAYNGGELKSSDLAHFECDDKDCGIRLADGAAKLVKFKVSGDLTTDKLKVTATATEGGLLVAASYDRNGALARVWTQALIAQNEELSFTTGLAKKSGYTYKIMLVTKDGFVPLCAGWSDTAKK